MRRGEIWTVSAGGPYAGKPRPALVVQGSKIGRLADEDLLRVNRALLVFLGMAAPSK